MPVVHVGPNARLVSDPEEEVFLLYTSLASLSAADGAAPFRGLGFLDARSDVLTVRLQLSAPDTSSDTMLGRGKAKKSGKRKKAEPEVVEIELAQDKTALNSRKGDTGSVLWQASVDFAQLVLQQHRFRREHSLFDFEALSSSSVLELGSGTGLLAVALGPLCRRFTATDILELVPLIQKNLHLNRDHLRSHLSEVSADSLDWIAVHSTPCASWTKLRLLPSLENSDGKLDVDLIVVVDCLYHPSLIPPLLSSLDYLSSASAQPPDVLVVAELRSEDVVREFLEGWLNTDDWTIWSLSTRAELGMEAGLGARYGVWLGRKMG